MLVPSSIWSQLTRLKQLQSFSFFHPRLSRVRVKRPRRGSPNIIARLGKAFAAQPFCYFGCLDPRTALFSPLSSRDAARLSDVFLKIIRVCGFFVCNQDQAFLEAKVVQSLVYIILLRTADTLHHTRPAGISRDTDNRPTRHHTRE